MCTRVPGPPPAAAIARAQQSDHSARSFGVYATIVALPRVPDEAWMRMHTSSGTRSIPNGYASRRWAFVVNGCSASASRSMPKRSSSRVRCSCSSSERGIVSSSGWKITGRYIRPVSGRDAGNGARRSPAGLAGSVQVAVMSRLGERIGVGEALGFATLATAVLAFVGLLLVRRSVTGYERALHQPWWMLSGGLLGLLIIFTVTYRAGRRASA